MSKRPPFFQRNNYFFRLPDSCLRHCSYRTYTADSVRFFYLIYHNFSYVPCSSALMPAPSKPLQTCTSVHHKAKITADAVPIGELGTPQPGPSASSSVMK